MESKTEDKRTKSQVIESETRYAEQVRERDAEVSKLTRQLRDEASSKSTLQVLASHQQDCLSNIKQAIETVAAIKYGSLEPPTPPQYFDGTTWCNPPTVPESGGEDIRLLRHIASLCNC